MLAARRLKLEMEPEAKKAIIDAGYEPRFGARPLRRAIQRWLQDPLSQAILEGGWGEGDTIVAKVKDPAKPQDGLRFEKKGAPAPATEAAPPAAPSTPSTPSTPGTPPSAPAAAQ
jgi:ATP-dependent Clp protease ATP-binding subunit ClpA